MISVSGDKTLKVWSYKNNNFELLYTLLGKLQIIILIRQLLILGHTDKIFAVQCSSNGKSILSGGYDKTIKIWDAETYTL